MGLLNFKVASSDNVNIQKETLDLQFLMKQINARKKVSMVGLISSCVFCLAFGVGVFFVMPDDVKHRTLLASLMVGCPLVLGAVLFAVFLCGIIKAKTLSTLLQQGFYRIDEDIITSKYTKNHRDNDGVVTSSRYITGIKNGKDVPEIEEEYLWKQSKIGERFWILEILDGKKVVYRAVYLSSGYDLSSELKMNMEAVTTTDMANARRVVKAAFDSGEYNAVPKKEFASVFLEDVMQDSSNKSKVKESPTEERKIVVCGVCGRRFNATKYGHTCPKCGAICMVD